MSAFIDESGNGNLDEPLVVAVVCTDDPSSIEGRLQTLQDTLSATRAPRGSRAHREFLRQGFHAADNSIEIYLAFAEHLTTEPGVQAYAIVSNRSDGQVETQLLLDMYAVVLGDILLRYRRAARIVVTVETNDGLRRHLSEIPSLTADRALAKSGRPSPNVALTVVEGAKNSSRLLAVADYIAHAVQRWAATGYGSNADHKEVRNLRRLQPLLSVIYSLESGLILNRRDTRILDGDS